MKSRIRHFLSVFVVAGIVSFVAEPARAELITYYFTGKITSVPNPPLYWQSFSVGDPVTGSIAYDPSLGYIQLPTSGSGMSVVIGSATVQSVGNASLQVLNDSFGQDNFNGYFTPISVNGQKQPQLSHAMIFSFSDTSQTVFSSTALPDSIDVGRFDIHTGAIFAGSGITVSFSIDTLEKVPIPVKIDIKPGSYPNSINLASSGVIPVAILSSNNFNAGTEVNPDSLFLAGAKVRVAGKSDKALCHEEDVNSDNFPDLICQFENELQSQPGDSTAVLEGNTFSGVPIRGEDTIQIVP